MSNEDRPRVNVRAKRILGSKAVANRWAHNIECLRPDDWTEYELTPIHEAETRQNPARTVWCVAVTFSVDADAVPDFERQLRRTRTPVVETWKEAA